MSNAEKLSNPGNALDAFATDQASKVATLKASALAKVAAKKAAKTKSAAPAKVAAAKVAAAPVPAAKPAPAKIVAPAKYFTNRPDTDLVLLDVNGKPQPFKYQGGLVYSVPGANAEAAKKACPADKQPAYLKGGWFICWSTNSTAAGAAQVKRTLAWRVTNDRRWSQNASGQWVRLDREAAAAAWVETSKEVPQP